MGPSSSASSSSSVPVANIWISPSPTSWSHCSQHLSVPNLNMWVSLFSACASSRPQHLGLPVLNTLVFPFSAPGFPCPEPGRPRGFTTLSPEDLTLHCFSFYLIPKQPRQHVPRRGRESRRKSCLQAPGWLSVVILEKEDDWSEIRATAIESLIPISPLNKPQHAPEKPNVALPAPASSISHL